MLSAALEQLSAKRRNPPRLLPPPFPRQRRSFFLFLPPPSLIGWRDIKRRALVWGSEGPRPPSPPGDSGEKSTNTSINMAACQCHSGIRRSYLSTLELLWLCALPKGQAVSSTVCIHFWVSALIEKTPPLIIQKLSYKLSLQINKVSFKVVVHLKHISYSTLFHTLSLFF